MPERLGLARSWGVEVLDMSGMSVTDVGDAVRELTDGRGADGTRDAVGMEAHRNPVSEKVINTVGRLPGAASRPMIEHLGIDRLAALHAATERRAGAGRCR